MLSILALTMQLQAAAVHDSAAATERAHEVQGDFERARRVRLPWAPSSDGRCDVRVGRFCWWYEGEVSAPVAEPDEIGQRRDALLHVLDSLGEASRGDGWIAGMRAFYRLEARRPAAADSVAQRCGAVPWWCDALRGATALAGQRVTTADSAFAAAMRAMPDSTRCAWRDIRTLLPTSLRAAYERQSCAERTDIEARYWLLATPRLGAPANEWRLEFLARRVITSLLATAVTPHRLSWGDDTAELILRYGWPVSWTRSLPPALSPSDPAILGHDPAPSYHFGARADLLADSAAASDDGWDLPDVHGESRFAHPHIAHIAHVVAQMARFERGDSSLIAAAWESTDDSLVTPVVVLGVSSRDGVLAGRVVGTSRRGHGLFGVAGQPALAGLELSDSVTRTLARTRWLLAPAGSQARGISDVLLFEPTGQDAGPLEEALSHASPSSSFGQGTAIGLYWESYGETGGASPVETSIRVERIDRGVLSAVRQRLGIGDPDSPVQIRWSESRAPANGVTPHALALDLSRLPAGRYRLRVALADGVRSATSRPREFELVAH